MSKCLINDIKLIKAMKGDRETCLNAGMDDYLIKPVKPEKLNQIIEKWLLHGKSAFHAETSNIDPKDEEWKF